MEPGKQLAGEHLYKCEKCGGYITKEKNDDFNRVFECSGYDDDRRHEWEEADEYPDTH
jgi:hypothetical protein